MGPPLGSQPCPLGLVQPLQPARPGEVGHLSHPIATPPLIEHCRARDAPHDAVIVAEGRPLFTREKGLLSLLLFECIPVQLSQGRGYLRDFPRRHVYLNENAVPSGFLLPHLPRFPSASIC